jgi:hypothetical protein
MDNGVRFLVDWEEDNGRFLTEHNAQITFTLTFATGLFLRERSQITLEKKRSLKA